MLAEGHKPLHPFRVHIDIIFVGMRLRETCNRPSLGNCECGGFTRLGVSSTFSSTRSEFLFRDTTYFREFHVICLWLVCFDFPHLNITQDLTCFYILCSQIDTFFWGNFFICSAHSSHEVSKRTPTPHFSQVQINSCVNWLKGGDLIDGDISICLGYFNLHPL